MIKFSCDYAEGAHIRILNRLIETNDEQTATYGLDYHSDNARGYIKKLCDCEGADVHFISGGTQANLIVISSILRPYQGVIAANTGHIATHETGSIEATGHKVLEIFSRDGKLTAEGIKNLHTAHYTDPNLEHTVQPAMVYISHPTESGTCYTKAELEAISAVCHELNLPLFLDGARLGYGIAAPNSELTIADIARLCDVFYIGGTKVGAMFGEAVVITNPLYQRDFRYHIKQKGAMMAKGRMMGIQFETLFEDGLYFDISKQAVALAMRLKSALADMGFEFLYDTYANQIFPIFDDNLTEKMQGDYEFSAWEKVSEGKSAVRLCTSWCTKAENVEQFIEDLKKLV